MKKLLFTIAFGVLASAAFAQEYTKEYVENTGTYERITERGPYLTNKFTGNWFIGVGGGVNMYMSKGDDKADIGDRIAPAVDAFLGKWFTPSVGFRVGYSGLSAKGASPVATDYAKKAKKDYYEKEFDFWSAQAHLLWNISNAIGGYKETRTWDIIPYVGAGYIEASKNGTKRRDGVGFAGLLNNFRLGGVVDLNLDARFMFAKPELDCYYTSDAKGKIKQDMDNMLTVTAGLSFKLGPKGGFKRPMTVAPADYTPYEQRINALEGELSTANERAARLARELEECNNRPVPQPEQVKVVKATPMHVYFNIGSARIAETDMVNIESIANTIKATPGKVYSVVGSADSSTGSVARNKQLSNQRAKAVADALTNRFGVDKAQLDVDALGGISSGGNPELDRVVIVEMKK